MVPPVTCKPPLDVAPALEIPPLAINPPVAPPRKMVPPSDALPPVGALPPAFTTPPVPTVPPLLKAEVPAAPPNAVEASAVPLAASEWLSDEPELLLHWQARRQERYGSTPKIFDMGTPGLLVT
jgi:hypothetical protein